MRARSPRVRIRLCRGADPSLIVAPPKARPRFHAAKGPGTSRSGVRHIAAWQRISRQYANCSSSRTFSVETKKRNVPPCALPRLADPSGPAFLLFLADERGLRGENTGGAGLFHEIGSRGRDCMIAAHHGE